MSARRRTTKSSTSKFGPNILLNHTRAQQAAPSGLFHHCNTYYDVQLPSGVSGVMVIARSFVHVPLKSPRSFIMEEMRRVWCSKDVDDADDLAISRFMKRHAGADDERDAVLTPDPDASRFGAMTVYVERCC